MVRTPRLPITLAVATLLFAACAAPASGPIVLRGGQSAEAGGGGEGGGAAEAAYPFSGQKYGYTIDAPSQMTEADDGSAATAQGSAERLAVRVATGSAVADALAYARDDLARRAPGIAAYVLRSAPARVRIGSRDVVRAVFSSTAGTNAVTGKPDPMTTAVYYVPKDATTLAVIEYTVQTSQFDPQGADDVAATFAWR